MEQDKLHALERENRASIKQMNMGTSKTDSATDRIEDDGDFVDEENANFKDFNYNSKRAKKASQVLLSINDD